MPGQLVSQHLHCGNWHVIDSGLKQQSLMLFKTTMIFVFDWNPQLH
jgi:hypothetical protein